MNAILPRLNWTVCCKWMTSLAVLSCCFGLSGVLLKGQVSNPIPPALTPGSPITDLTGAVGFVRAKASPDECWTGLGLNTEWDFINQSTPNQPCASNQIPKVNQGYIWGQVLVGNKIFFGTFANALCIGGNEKSNPMEVPGEYACEYAESPYAQARGGPLPDQLGDDRPPRMYVYNIATHAIQDITPQLGGSPPASVCGPTSFGNGLCLDTLWNATLGMRSATSYVEPTTGNTYVIISGQGSGGINFFAWGITENRWVGKFQLPGYSDMRHWLTYNGVLYAAVFGTDSATGALFRYTGNFAVIPPSAPSESNGYNAVPICGTTSTSNPPTSTSGFCIAFQDVGDFDGPASEVTVAPPGTADAGRIFVGTWAPPFGGTNVNNVQCGIFMSPVVPSGGLTPSNAGQWKEVWEAGNYEPDPVIVVTYGTGAMTFFDGYLYWGTLNPPFDSLLEFQNVYGPLPSGQGIDLEYALNVNRTAAVFRGQGFSTASPTIQLLYGATQLPVFHSTSGTSAGTWVLTNNNVPVGSCIAACGVSPLYGSSGFNDFWTAYIWSMTVFNSKLYVGTFNWSFLVPGLVAQLGITLPAGFPIPQPSQFGASLFDFPDSAHAAAAVNTSGIGNYLNYGIRNLIPYGTTSLFVGTANPFNLATSGNTNPGGGTCVSARVCRGGWELIEVDPVSPSSAR